ncbi:MAG: hypothetical protein Kow00103_01370 [Candidatus Caldatribacteriota bacterium]
MVPLLSLGIPGDAVTAVMLGALLLIGIRPGPLLFKEHPEIINPIFAGMFLANILIIILGLLSIKIFPQILKTPDSILFPIIFVLCFLGAFSLNNSVYDMFIALVFGIIGYIMRKNYFPIAPVVLGVILGPIAEDELGRALIISHGNWIVLLKSPIAIFFYFLSLLSLLYSLKRQFPKEQKIK